MRTGGTVFQPGRGSRDLQNYKLPEIVFLQLIVQEAYEKMATADEEEMNKIGLEREVLSCLLYKATIMFS